MNIIGTGIDITSTDRLRQLYEKHPSVAEKILTPAEIEYCMNKRNMIQHLAGRFSVKEAIYKALDGYVENLFWQDINISSRGKKPLIEDDCRLAEIISENSLGYSLSISHEIRYAVAHAVFWKEK